MARKVRSTLLLRSVAAPWAGEADSEASNVPRSSPGGSFNFGVSSSDDVPGAKLAVDVVVVGAEDAAIVGVAVLGVAVVPVFVGVVIGALLVDSWTCMVR